MILFHSQLQGDTPLKNVQPAKPQNFEQHSMRKREVRKSKNDPLRFYCPPW